MVCACVCVCVCVCVCYGVTSDCAADVGSNIGIHARFLFEPELYPQQQYSALFFDKYFPKTGRVKRKDVCVVGFEPNPKHRPRLQRLQSYYRSLGLQVFWFFAGVGK